MDLTIDRNYSGFQSSIQFQTKTYKKIIFKTITNHYVLILNKSKWIAYLKMEVLNELLWLWQMITGFMFFSFVKLLTKVQK